MASDIITSGGKGQVTLALVNATSPIKFVAWGTGSGQVASSTALAAAAAPTTVTASTGTIAQTTTTTTNDTAQIVGTVTAGGALAITEMMVTTNATMASGTMSLYSDFLVVNVASGDAIQGTWNVKFA